MICEHGGIRGSSRSRAFRACAILLAIVILLSAFLSYTASAEDGYFETNHSDYGRDSDVPPDGLFNFLTVNVSLMITWGGLFLLEGVLYSPGSTLITSDSWSGSLSNGSRTVQLDFDGIEIALSGEDGPYRVELTLMDPFFTILDTDTYYTASYQAADFQIPVAILYPPHSDIGIDTDINGKFDWLAVDVRIKMNLTAFIKLNSQLLDSTETQAIETKIETGIFTAGIHTLRVNFTGYLIRLSGFDGPYHVRLKLYNSGEALLSSGTHVTQPYLSTDFDDTPATLEPPHTDFGMDLDVNSLFDYLVVIVKVNIAEAGEYTIEGELEEDKIVTPVFIAYTRNETFLSTGVHSVWLHFLGNTVRIAGVNGRYKEYIQIVDSDGTVCSYGNYLTATNFQANDFDVLPAFFSPPHDDDGFDVNANGTYDFLLVNASLSVRLTFTYITTALLWNSGRTVLIDEISETDLLSSGTATVTLSYDGMNIYNSSINGPYFVRLYLYDPFTNLINMSSHNTFAYQYTSFEHYDMPDKTPPSISSVSEQPDPQEAGLATNISAVVTDNVGVEDVFCHVTGPVGQQVGNFTMLFSVSAGRYYLDRAYDIIGTNSYRIWASDLAGNWGTASSAFTIVDTTLPTIEDLRIDPKPQEVFGNVNVSAIVGDNHRLQEVSLDIPAIGNLTMTLDVPTGRYFRIVSASTTGSFPFTLWAIDVAGNTNQSSDALVFVDSVPPTIQDLSVLPREQQPGGFVNISAAISDNYLLSWTNIKVFDPNGSLIVDRALTYDPATSRYFLLRAYVTLGTYTFNVTASDQGGLTAETSGNFNITTSVLDTTPPSINSHSASPDPQEVYLSVRITANVTDNVGVTLVKVHVHSPVGASLGNTTMSFDGTDYFKDGTYDELGTFQYCIWAEDARGNAAMECGEFVVRDSTRPIISSASASPITQEVHLQVNITATATDNFALQGLHVEVESPNGSSLGNTTMSFDTLTGKYWFNRAYSDLGPHTYTITAEDTSANMAVFSGVFYIRDSIKPTADAGPSVSITLGDSVTFDASGSTDNDVIVNFTWTFMDGPESRTLYGVTTGYVFENLGVSTVTLIVKDRADNPDTDVMYVTVNAPPQPPAKPKPPTQLSTFISEPDSIVLTWTAPVLREDNSWLINLAGYDVYRSASSGPPYDKINAALVLATVFTDSNVFPGTTYYYTVKAVDSNGLESNYSSEVSAIIVPKGSVSGTVTDRSDNPLPGATIVLKSNGQALRTTNTDVNGHFLISDVPTGNYVLRVSSEGYYIKESPVLIEAGKTTDMNIILDEVPAPPIDGGEGESPLPLVAVVLIPLVIIIVLVLYLRARARRREKQSKQTTLDELDRL